MHRAVFGCVSDAPASAPSLPGRGAKGCPLLILCAAGEDACQLSTNGGTQAAVPHRDDDGMCLSRLRFDAQEHRGGAT
jgi:hypothetical protein